MPKILIVHAVLARSFPTDKFNLVKLLKKQGKIVGSHRSALLLVGLQLSINKPVHSNRHQNTNSKHESGSTIDVFVAVHTHCQVTLNTIRSFSTDLCAPSVRTFLGSTCYEAPVWLSLWV